jgi:Protein of unknown function (DUF3551)
MRIPALAILTVSAVLTAASASAQTYNPRYPVCLQSYAIGGEIIKCAFDTLAQCNASTRGGGGQCINNPFFAGAQEGAGPNYPRQGRLY